MPDLEKHYKESKKRTGKEYRQVHEWADREDEKKAVRHDLGRMVENIRYVEGEWGEEAAREYVQHVKDDVRARMEKTLAYFGI